ncbi:hypothetical protein [Adhaeribacter arboris]|uniref:hypothetical protein n=1 Tax=Adhaeribacter arboris TaxID=2072846 RepID=UPI0011B1E71C|nr:hypothetical protein [Adhaeribacter arboris]
MPAADFLAVGAVSTDLAVVLVLVLLVFWGAGVLRVGVFLVVFGVILSINSSAVWVTFLPFWLLPPVK